MSNTGIVKDERYLNHHMGDYHPESPRRLEVIYGMLEDPDMKGQFGEVPVRQADKNELLLVHSADYVEKIAATEGKEYTYLDPGRIMPGHLYGQFRRTQKRLCPRETPWTPCGKRSGYGVLPVQ
jgi:acetoin utilization deacetylase AcuC-like enzyme